MTKQKTTEWALAGLPEPAWFARGLQAPTAMKLKLRGQGVQAFTQAGVSCVINCILSIAERIPDRTFDKHA